MKKVVSAIIGKGISDANVNSGFILNIKYMEKINIVMVLVEYMIAGPRNSLAAAISLET